MDAWELETVSYLIENPVIFDQVNAIMKRAKKRALGDAIKGAAAVSEYFTVDLEDLPHPTYSRFDPDVIEGSVIPETAETRAGSAPTPSGNVSTNGKPGAAHPQAPGASAGQPSENPWGRPDVLDQLRFYARSRMKDPTVSDAELAKLAGVESWSAAALQAKYPKAVNDALQAILKAWDAFTSGEQPSASSVDSSTNTPPEIVPEKHAKDWHLEMADYIARAYGGLTEHTALTRLQRPNWESVPSKGVAQLMLLSNAAEQGHELTPWQLAYHTKDQDGKRCKPYLSVPGYGAVIRLVGAGKQTGRDLLRDLNHPALTEWVDSVPSDGSPQDIPAGVRLVMFVVKGDMDYTVSSVILSEDSIPF